MPSRPLLSTVLVLTLLAPASAQGTLPASTLPGSVFKSMGQVGAPATAAGTPAATADLLKFRPSAQVRQQVIKDFLALVAGKSPELATELEKTLAGTDLFREIEKEERRMFGPTMSVDNVADVWATYWGYAWLMARHRTDDPTPAQMKGLRAQFQGLLLGMPQVTRGTDTVKQQMSDTLTLQVVLFGLLAEAWKDSPGNLAQFGDELTQTSRDLGFDLGKLTLTDRGFVVQK